MLRFPDFFCRLHAATKCDTLGQTCILLGIALFEGFSLLSLKVLAISFFFLIASPTAAQALAKGAYISGVRPELEDGIDEYREPAGDYIREKEENEALIRSKMEETVRREEEKEGER
ncbi:monovalent cation/proton antiporter MnhG/PhaG subunit [Methanocalculus alkaliphilus]|nr:monovalent cation/proton antiporter MnhG/PhaG subunit [Methanocalculus alkaliphilus]